MCHLSSALLLVNLLFIQKVITLFSLISILPYNCAPHGMVIWYNFLLIYRAHHYWLWFTLWCWSYHSWYTYSVSELSKLIWTRKRLSDYDNIFKQNSFAVFVFWRRRNCRLWFDYLIIYDGPDDSSSQIGTKLCGNTNPTEIESSGPTIHILFYTDSSEQRDGFHIQVLEFGMIIIKCYTL